MNNYNFYFIAPFEPLMNIEELFPNSWYLTHIDKTFKRYYKQNKL